MLHDFIATHEIQIADRAILLAQARDPLPHAGPDKDEIRTFLAQVSTTLKQAGGGGTSVLSSTAGYTGARMLRGGQTIVAVVQSYGDVWQAVTAVAAESQVPISADDFCVLNRCLDEATAHAVSEYSRIAEERRATAEVHRLGVTAHELRDHLQTAELSLRSLQSTGAPIEGLCGQLLDCALANLKIIVERMLLDAKPEGGLRRRDPIELAPFLQEVALTAALNAQSRGLVFSLDSEAAGHVEGDRHLLLSAVMNLVNNALKFTRPGGEVRLVVRMSSARLFIAVQDQCGGLPETASEVVNAFTDRRGIDRAGLGLGLSIAKNIVRAHGGDISVRNIPDCGCVFTIEMPLAAPAVPDARPS